VTEAQAAPFRLLCLDVRDDRSVAECASQVLREAGHIDVVVNCAGVVVDGSAEEMLMEEVIQQIETNLLGTIRVCKAVLPGMRSRGGGLIINVSSLGGLMGMPFQSSYCASKYGIEGFSESLQIEVRRFGICVVVVDPGDVHTEITAHRGQTRGCAPDSPYREALSAAIRSQSQSELHGWEPERIARVVGRIIELRRPRFRYTPGLFVERISPALRRLIPDRLFLRLVATFFGVK